MPITPFVLWTTAGVVGAGLLVWLLSPILAPFLAAAILAYICDPLADRLEARRVPRAVAALIVMLGFLLIAVGLVLLGFAANLLLVPVVMFYLLRDWDVLIARSDQLVPSRWRSRVRAIAAEMDSVLSEFLRGQMVVMLAMALFYSAGLALAGLDFAVPIGIVAGALVFVPYLGVTVGIIAASLTGWMQFQGIEGLLPVWGVLTIGQILEGFWLTPWLVGDRIGLHPVAVIFALMAFGQIFGFFGVLLALPASAAVLVGLRHLREHYERLEARVD